MSGGIRTGISRPPKEPALPKRPELVRTTIDGLPSRNEIKVVASIADIEPLAKVTKKFQVAGQPTLSFVISNYIADIKLEDLVDSKLEKQAFQTFLHEMMHMALWDDLSITHSEDENSLLHYYVEGDTLDASPWDLEVMKKAANRIGHIVIDIKKIVNLNISDFLILAIAQWNTWIGRDFFILL